VSETPLRRNRDFLLLQSGLLLSSSGSQMTAIAYPLLVLALWGTLSPSIRTAPSLDELAELPVRVR